MSRLQAKSFRGKAAAASREGDGAGEERGEGRAAARAYLDSAA